MLGRAGWRVAAAALVVLWLAPIAWADGDDEPNDTRAQASRLTLFFERFTGSISTSSDVDFYKITVTVPTDVTVQLWTRSIGSELEAALALYDSSGNLATSNGTLLGYSYKEWDLQAGVASEDPILYAKLAPGTWYFAVVSASTFRRTGPPSSGGSGKYELNARVTTYGTALQDPHENNDTRLTATAITLPYKSRGTNLIHLGDIDWYRFSAKKDQVVSIDVDALQLRGKPGYEMAIEARVGLFDDTGKLISAAAKGSDPDDGYPDDPALLFEATRDGTYYVAVTMSLDTDFVTGTSAAAFLADPELSSAKGRIGYYDLQVRTVEKLYFPQIANGSFGSVSFRTSIILLNTSGRDATGSVSFFRSDGTPLQLSFAGSAADTRYFFSLKPKGSLLVSSDGLGTGESGYAIVQATAPIGGSAIFSQYDDAGALVSEAGVAAAEANTFFTLPVDVTGEFNTGLALANLVARRTVSLSLKLVNEKGETTSTKTLTLGADKHTAVYVSGAGQLFPDTRNFRGSLQVSGDASILAVALRSGRRALTTLPVAALEQGFQPVTLYFPHVAVGASQPSYSSTLILVNSGFFPVTGTIRFTRSDGTPMVVTTAARSASSHAFSIPAQGTLFFEALATGALATGYAVVEADHGIAGTLVFSQLGSTGEVVTEAAVPVSARYGRFYLFAQSETISGMSFDTGFALASTGTAVTVSYTLAPATDPSQVMTLGPTSLEAGKHLAEFVSGTGQLFPTFTGRGLLEVQATPTVPAVTLRLTSTTLTSLPVVPIP